MFLLVNSYICIEKWGGNAKSLRAYKKNYNKQGQPLNDYFNYSHIVDH